MWRESLIWDLKKLADTSDWPESYRLYSGRHQGSGQVWNPKLEKDISHLCIHNEFNLLSEPITNILIFWYFMLFYYIVSNMVFRSGRQCILICNKFVVSLCWPCSDEEKRSLDLIHLLALFNYVFWCKLKK